MVKRTLRVIVKNSLLLVMACLLFFGGKVLADSYESYKVNDDEEQSVYGVNWAAQTFTTSTTVHTVSSVSLKLCKVGDPGTVVVEIKGTTGGKPAGPVLAIGSMNGTTLGASPGAWETITVTPAKNLAANTMYAIVVYAAAGGVSDYLGWRDDGSTPAYAGGAAVTSGDSGSTWTIDASKDFMFEVIGSDSITISGTGADCVNVFSTTFEDGDWYFAIHYLCEAAPAYPGEIPSDCFDIILYDTDGTTPIAKQPLAAWGNKAQTLYLARDLTATLDWGSAYVLKIVGKNAMAGVSASYTLQGSDWIGPDLFYLDSWVRTTAQSVGTYYNVTMYSEHIGSVNFSAGEGVLTTVGSEVFLKGMPDLDTLRPNLFYVVYHNAPGDTETTWTHAYENAVTWQDQVGPYVAGIFTTIGGVFNLGGQPIGGILFAGAFVICCAIGIVGDKTPGVVAMVVSVPVLLAGWYFRLIPFALLGILCMVVIFLAVWVVFLRGT